MTPADLRALREQASPEEWRAVKFVNPDNGDRNLTPEELGEYVRRSVEKSAERSGTSDFLAIRIEEPDGTSDVCLVGNGPRSPHNARIIAAAVNHLPALLALWEAQIDSLSARVEGNGKAFGAAQQRIIAALHELEKAKVST